MATASNANNFPVFEGDGRTTIGVPLRVGRENRAELRDLVSGLLDLGRRAFVLDLADCRYFDSAGLGVLVAINNAIVTRGGTLRVSHVDDDIRELFHLTQLDASILTLEPESHGARRGNA